MDYLQIKKFLFKYQLKMLFFSFKELTKQHLPTILFNLIFFYLSYELQENILLLESKLNWKSNSIIKVEKKYKIKTQNLDCKDINYIIDTLQHEDIKINFVFYYEIFNRLLLTQIYKSSLKINSFKTFKINYLDYIKLKNKKILDITLFRKFFNYFDYNYINKKYNFILKLIKNTNNTINLYYNYMEKFNKFETQTRYFLYINKEFSNLNIKKISKFNFDKILIEKSNDFIKNLTII